MSILPIGTYTLTFTHDGFETLKIPSITVQANRTATVNAVLQVGQVGTVVEVQADPLLNAVDTTNGYVMDKSRLTAVPLPTGSFTGLAILSPGVNAELSSGTGANAGLGNQPVWANGQRDTSNTFLLNGVDARNLFNGKTTSQVASARSRERTPASHVFGTERASRPEQRVHLPRDRRIVAFAGAGDRSGSSREHFDVRRAAGIHQRRAHRHEHRHPAPTIFTGALYVHRGTNWLNADPYFYNADPNIPRMKRIPTCTATRAGGTVGVPIMKDKLFFSAAISTLTFPIRRLELRARPCLSG